ncbi:hypothetical protein MBLNU230_g2361t1 [Neophaeotheca triangularis]
MANQTSNDSTAYLESFINRTLHLHTSDGRMFSGQMKCTDNERNIILSMTHEYRKPSEQDLNLAAARHERAVKEGARRANEKMKIEMKKRFVGLVVVPGKYIERIEVEE